MQQLQSTIAGLECDFLGDINVFMGDLNYRLNSSFTEMTNVQEQAISMIPTHDQLTIARQ